MRVLFVLITLASLAGIASAQHVCRGRNVAVAAPAYHAAAVVVDHHTHAVKAVKVIAQPEYYYSVSDGYRDSVLADAIAYRVLQLQRQGLLRAESQQPAATPPTPRHKEPPAEAPPPMPRAGNTQPAPSALVKVLESRCVKCHQGPGVNGIDLSDPAAVPEGARWKSYALANAGEMPKGGKAIPDDEVAALYQWAKSARTK